MGAIAPQQYHHATEHGQTFAMVRERADLRDCHVSIFPDGNADHSMEALADSEC